MSTLLGQLKQLGRDETTAVTREHRGTVPRDTNWPFMRERVAHVTDAGSRSV